MPNALDELARRIAALEAALPELSRASPLAYSSVDDGALTVTADGKLRAIIGQQPDGTTAVNVVNGPPPPTPTTPTAAGVLGGVRASWDGQFDGGEPTPLDFTRVEVHASTTGTDFTPGPETLAGTIESPQGGSVLVPTTVPVTVLLVARSSSGKPSEPSGPASAAPAKVVADEVLAGIVTELALADDAVTAAKVAVGAIDANAIADAAIIASKLGAAAVQAAALAPGAVTGPAIAADSITSREIAAGAVTAAELAAGSVSTTKLAAGAVTASQIAAGAVTATALAANSVSAGKIATDAITAGKLAADAVTAREIKALSITGDRLAANSITAAQLAAGAITTNALAVGSVGPAQLNTGTGNNLIPDPSFEGPQAAALVGGGWDRTAPGNNSGWALTLTVPAGTTVATSFAKQLTTVPVVPGERLWLAVDMKTDAAWPAGQQAKFFCRWEDSKGAVLKYEGPTATPGPSSPWTRYASKCTAPAQAVRATVWVQAYQALAGALSFDNAEIRPILSTPGTGQRAELSPEGLRLFDNDGQEAVSLVTGQPTYLSISDGTSRVASISERGDAGFQQVSVAGLSVAGEGLDRILDRRPRGVVAWASGAKDVSTSGGVEIGIYELPFVAEAGRHYRITWDPILWASATGGSVVTAVRNGGAGAPLVSSPMLRSHASPAASPVGHGFQVPVRASAAVGRGLAVGLNRLLFTIAQVGAPSGAVLHHDANQPTIAVVEDIGAEKPASGVWNTGGASAPPPLVTYSTIYQATWSGTYKTRSAFNSYYNNEMLQGNYPDAGWGIQASLVGFDSNAIGSDLNGATLNRAEVYLYPTHWYYNSGGNAAIRVHGWTARPGSFSADGDTLWQNGWPPNQGRWVDISSIFPTWGRGIALDPNSNDLTCYGRFNGAGMANPPLLRLTYTK
ncbi:hypothetical protein AB0K51_09435 [Kitasatospora sp. NPDC049285]|uniref:hypothetical protein n=1 Tax=Kitasatospora sp. NPDC049285 TaxID=3157096 RepID=UPI0034188CB0